jgi:alpha-tubulin suppressor-like RCC1 family protein
MFRYQTRNFSTSLYIWKAMPRFSTKASQTGDKFAIPSGTPTRVETVKNPISINMGTRASGIIDAEGNLYTFGSGNWGVLGHGTEDNVRFTEAKLVKRLVERDMKVSDVAFGRYHAAAAMRDGSLWTWGYGGKPGFFSFFN